MAENNGAKKVFVIIGMVLLGIVLCYFSVALYFYFATPNDIASKLSVWNLMSDNEIGEMYLEATYEVRYGDEDFVGVNVDKEGYVLTCNHNFDGYNNEKIVLYNNSGAMYNGEIIFSNDVLNLAVLKISDYFEESKNLDLPYVKTGDLRASIFGREYLAIGSPFDEGNISKVSNVGYDSGFVTTVYDEIDVVDYICLDSISFTVKNYESTSQGALFDKTGRLVGLTYAYMINEGSVSDADYYAVSTAGVGSIIKKIKNDENLEINIEGFDMQELAIYLQYQMNENQIFYDGKWLMLDDNLMDYHLKQEGVYLNEDFVLNNKTLSKNNLITSISYNGYSESVVTRYELYNTLYSFAEGTSFTLTSIDLTTGTVIKTDFVI